jgi:hypothetical protein
MEDKTTNKVASQLRELADEIESDNEPDVPSELTEDAFESIERNDGFKEIIDGIVFGHTLVLDNNNDVWIVEPDGSLAGTSPHFLNTSDIETLYELTR